MSSANSYRDLAVFTGIDAPDVEKLLGLGRRRQVADGELILSQDDDTRELFCVLSGGVEVLRDTGSGPRNLAIIKAGDCFGEIGFFTGEPRTASVRAIAPTELLLVLTAELESMIDRHPKLAARFLQNILRIVTGRYAEMNTQLARMVFWLGA